MPDRARSGEAAATSPQPATITQSLQEYGRGIAGGLLFSMPLLFTNEVWDAGYAMTPARQVIYLAGTIVLLFGYNRFAGLRRDSSWVEVGIDSVEELGIGVVLSVVVLLVLGRIGGGQQWDEIIGRVAVEAMTVAIGVSVGTAQLGGGEGPGASTNADEAAGYGGQLVLAFCGAVLFAANVAPTEEVVLLGVEASPLHLIGVALLSLTTGGLILFFSDFRGSSRSVIARDTPGMLRGAAGTYAVALLTSAAILWIFGRLDGVSLYPAVARTIMLGLPSTLGASAGRLLIQSQ